MQGLLLVVNAVTIVLGVAVKNDWILKLSEEGTRSTEYLTYRCTLSSTNISLQGLSYIRVWTVTIRVGGKVNQLTNQPHYQQRNYLMSVSPYLLTKRIAGSVMWKPEKFNLEFCLRYHVFYRG